MFLWLSRGYLKGETGSEITAAQLIDEEDTFLWL
jgi:hypothetical protein